MVLGPDVIDLFKGEIGGENREACSSELEKLEKARHRDIAPRALNFMIMVFVSNIGIIFPLLYRSFFEK
ncbi:MAG: hypothetical protein ACK5PQ_02430 [Alphaproteobacteria bacterium]